MGEEAQPQVGTDFVTYAQASRQLAEIQLEQQDWSGVPVGTIDDDLTATREGNPWWPFPFAIRSARKYGDKNFAWRNHCTTP